jgi:DNA mismatch endonuclease, patch repair protein
MRAIRTRNTEPEIRVRRIARQLGFSLRRHKSNLPGKPDLVFPLQRSVVFVHGCFWHQHERCHRGSPPQSNVAFWQSKLARNRSRDSEQLAAVRRLGWRALVIWECQTKDERRLTARLLRFLVSDRGGMSRKRQKTRTAEQTAKDS